MPNDRDGWEVLGGAVVRRRQRLGLTQQDVTARGGPSTAKLRDIEGGRGKSSRPRTLNDLDAALDWPNGTSSSISSLMRPDWTTDEREVDEWIQNMVHLDADRPLPSVIRDVADVSAEIDSIQANSSDELRETVAAVVSLLQLSGAKAARGDVEGAARATEQAGELMLELRQGRAAQVAQLASLVTERIRLSEGEPSERPPITTAGAEAGSNQTVVPFPTSTDDLNIDEFPSDEQAAAARRGGVEPGDQGDAPGDDDQAP